MTGFEWLSDLANPKTNKKNAGFCQRRKRRIFNFAFGGDSVDTFRHLYPDSKGGWTISLFPKRLEWSVFVTAS
ncbi:hypothetical protein CEXT_162641 [Caerostris extrusa]|uniref:Uncharacterized protein n=1 Tax=Caerostris extrusa TaxID=172846 RepID=A0AAV4QSN9_CAEEX|nr:hypothetical protein CEXT_162641 [Caerostris extrusa]